MLWDHWHGAFAITCGYDLADQALLDAAGAFYYSQLIVFGLIGKKIVFLLAIPEDTSEPLSSMSCFVSRAWWHFICDVVVPCLSTMDL